jgi:GAF domain-containing protein
MRQPSNKRNYPVGFTNQACVDDGFQAITSLSRAVADGARLPDVGSLLWVLLRQMVPCDAMALSTLDADAEHLVIRFAAGAHAPLLHGLTRPAASGIAGWVAVHRRPLLNAEPVFDLGRTSAASALRSSVIVPLIDNGSVVAVLSLYSKDLLAFTDDHVSMLELLGPRLALALGDAVVAADEDRALDPRPMLQLVPREASLDAGTPLFAAEYADQ